MIERGPIASDELARIKAPTRLLVGEEDIVTEPAASERLLVDNMAKRKLNTGRVISPAMSTSPRRKSWPLPGESPRPSPNYC